MKPDLSIIIPCYNCEKTVAETVDSCYNQGLGDSFEIIMVDDGSTDGTRELMGTLSRTHNNIKIFFHEKNLGGGATRNTAVKNARADVIFCIDSDDSLPDGTLDRMLAYLNMKKCDGVLFSGAYSFSSEKSRYKEIRFSLDMDNPISLDVLFSGKSWAAGEYFMYTKKSFLAAGRYPIDHGFDTQGFGFKYVARGMKAYVCPDTFMYKRQLTCKRSYFERSYNAGEYSVNYYIILREHIDIFSKKVRDLILNYDIFNKNTLEENILIDLQKEYSKNPKVFFTEQFKISEHNPEYIFQEGRYMEAFESLISSEEKYTNMDFDTIRYACSAIRDDKITTSQYKETIANATMKGHAYDLLRPTIYQRINRRLRKEYKKICAKYT